MFLGTPTIKQASGSAPASGPWWLPGPAGRCVLGLAMNFWLMPPNAGHAQHSEWPLLPEAELMAQPAVRSLEAALARPDSVFRLELSGRRRRVANPSSRILPSLQVPEAIAGLRRLQWLRATGRRANDGKWPLALGQLPNLQWLDLGKSGLRVLPESFGNLASLATLRLNGNLLAVLPTSFENLATLQELDLSHNLLFLVPVQAQGLHNLQRLDVSHNRSLSVVPPHIGHLQTLQAFSAKGCAIQALPEAIGNLHALVELNLADNRLRELPTSLANLLNLQVLNLRNNHLSTLPTGLEHLASLRELDVRGNAFSKADKARIRQMLPNAKVRV